MAGFGRLTGIRIEQDLGEDSLRIGLKNTG
jgi:hypothetical protein